MTDTAIQVTDDIVENRLYRIESLLVGIASIVDDCVEDGVEKNSILHLATAARTEVDWILDSLPLSGGLNAPVRIGLCRGSS